MVELKSVLATAVCVAQLGALPALLVNTWPVVPKPLEAEIPPDTTKLDEIVTACPAPVVDPRAAALFTVIEELNVCGWDHNSAMLVYATVLGKSVVPTIPELRLFAFKLVKPEPLPEIDPAPLMTTLVDIVILEI